MMGCIKEYNKEVGGLYRYRFGLTDSQRVMQKKVVYNDHFNINIMRTVTIPYDIGTLYVYLGVEEICVYEDNFDINVRKVYDKFICGDQIYYGCYNYRRISFIDCIEHEHIIWDYLERVYL